MRQRNKYLLALMVLLMVVFAIGKVTFLYYNRDICPLTPSQWLGSLWQGALLDLRTVALLLIVPALASLVMRKRLRWLLAPYFVIVGLAIAATVMADMVMYEFWQFKLCAVHLSYAASPEGTTNSVSTWFLVSRALGVLAFVLLVAVPAIWMTPRKAEGHRPWLMAAFVFIVALLPIGIGSCYNSDSPMLADHAATNPTFRFFHSFGDDARYTPTKCNPLAVRQAYLTSDSVTDTLLTTQRPNILVIQLESYGSQFVREMAEGSVISDHVSPQLSRLIPEGIFWEQYYSNSFRTDRGTVCAYSGWTSYPTVSPMKRVSMHPRLSSLPRALHQAGYQTGYMYAGAMTNMGKMRYLADMDFESLMDETYFTRQEMNSSWGANDSTSAMKMYKTIKEIKPDAQWMMVWQTISSHEPWDVPYHRLDDKVQNAFAYTDQCLGQLIDSLRTLPVWDRLLVIVIPDHGILYRQTYDRADFFHSPMLWLGGAVREPRRMPTLMNQSDIAATLLAQMGLPHHQFPWSRNVLSPDYKPSVYCTYPAGLFYKDLTGETLYDLTAQRFTAGTTKADSLRLSKALHLLHTSYSLIPNP